jgi:NAD(P)-dependent dehydrogenase (short-subunit alcohol dehydrogenase family)
MMAEPNGTMSGKVCMVTGATSGIGAVAAEALAAAGAKVIVVGRNPEKCAQTVEQILQRTGNRDVESLCADLSSQTAVRALAQEFLKHHNGLDVLLNNAGAIFFKRQLSTDGIEMTFALNHLGYFLLTTLLLETLKRSAPARIVNVASDAHTMVKQFDFDDPQGERRYKALRAYALSKLANILFTLELDRRLEGTGVTANSLHPGLVATQFGVNNGWKGRAMRWLSDLFSISLQEGAKTPIYLACSPEVADVSGQYFVRERPARSSAAARDAAAAARLWTLSESLTGQSSAG